MVETKAISYKYPGGRLIPYPDLSVQTGEALLIIGQSGCGKTTLLHLLGGLLVPTGGQIAIKGQDITRLGAKELDKFRGKHIGFIFQRSHFVQSLTVLENIELAAYFAGIPQNTNRLKSIAGELGISGLLHKRPAQLSQGEQQRASIARAIAHQPQVVLADEPTSSLDDSRASTVATLLQQLCAQHGAALITVTHDARLKALFKNQVLLS
ncbi:MAG: ATP-binding cassette domain-containing protein [Chitinophagales bacterium]|jgi:putative ABC transport system ATP-binding protein|nr:ATP-binding cassette domain-containing protein [Chitinophagales bacterium]